MTFHGASLGGNRLEAIVKKALVFSLFLLAMLMLSSPAALAQSCSSAPNNGW